MMTTSTDTTESAGPSRDQIMERLQGVEDPELLLSVVDLGLIYDADFDPATGTVNVLMTLTSPGCPLGGILQGSAYAALKDLPLVKDVDVKITFTPPWDPRTMATEDIKMMLGIW
jgi:metal-sulfur cluster biosynthetic enzyme